MNFSDEQFRDLEEELNLTEKSKAQLRSRIIHYVDQSKKRTFKAYKWITATICILLIFTSPFYSKTMAKIVEKILPITINSSYSNEQDHSDITTQVFELVEKEGYTVNSVGALPSPFTIDISLFLDNTTLKQAKEFLEPKVTKLLSDKGYDEYKLKFIEAPAMSETHSEEEFKEKYHLAEKVHEIVKNVFTSHGYAEEVDDILIGFESKNFTIEVPNHVQELTNIAADIEKEIESKHLDVKDIEVTTYNLEHRRQDNRWGTIASDIYH
ncbi:hypothetical protein [Metabacillus malikii]|uniref:DUF4030 domain-containing protein n=1 Tax=Metabacillus malikii TaxID=1504265 RepID=A0ABT9ZL69_9BACI|nr:hypothetical protein [Metabacillus malikii]MDQ0232639.1 hypothetical protein [Metabacillus malikii]